MLEKLKNNKGKIFKVTVGFIVVITFYFIETSKSESAYGNASEVAHASEEAEYAASVCDRYSDEQIKKITSETVISKEEINQYIDKLSEILGAGNKAETNKYINQVDLTNENGVSLEYLEDFPYQVYLNNEIYTGKAYKKNGRNEFRCVTGWKCRVGQNLKLETWRLVNFINGKVDGQRVLIARDIYDSDKLKFLHLGNYKNGKRHGNFNLYDSRGKITTNTFYLEGKMCYCTGDDCE